MASFRRAVPSFALWERPRNALLRTSGDQPGRLAQGPDEKCGLAGLTAGFTWSVMCLPFQIDAPRWGGVAHSRRGRCGEDCQSGKGIAIVAGGVVTRSRRRDPDQPTPLSKGCADPG